MRIDLEKTSFMVPQGFRDVTNYSFKSPPGQLRELLTVMYEPVPKDVKTLDQLMESRRQRLGVAGEGMLKLEDVQPAKLAGLEARQTSYTLEDAGEKYREWMVVAFVNPSLYVQVTYTASISDPGAQKRFAHIKESALLAGKPRPGVAAGAAAGFVRRPAGQMTLDVPEKLRPPRAYLFVSADERIRLTINENLGKPGPTPADPAENLKARTADGSKLGEMKESTFSAGGGRGAVIATTLMNPDGKPSAVRQGLVLFGNDLTVQYGGQGPLELSKEVEAAVNALQGSISKRGG